MTAPILAPAAFCIIATVAHVASIVIAMLRLRRNSLGAAPSVQNFPPVSLVRPLFGLDNYAADTLRSTFDLDYPRYEILFCVAAASDPVVPLVEDLIAEYPNANAKLLIGDDRVSGNPKLNNVVKGWRAASHDWIVLADSNVLMPRDYIRQLFASWRADTGLVASPPVGCRPQGVWAELECAFLNTYQARWQYVIDSFGRGFAQGKTMLWRRADLERAGGIAALGKEVAEDAAATKIVRSSGLNVRLVESPVRAAAWLARRRGGLESSSALGAAAACKFSALLPAGSSGRRRAADDRRSHRGERGRAIAGAGRGRARHDLVWRRDAARGGGRMALAVSLSVLRVDARLPFTGAVLQGARRQRVCLARQRNAGRAHAPAPHDGPRAAATAGCRRGQPATAACAAAAGVVIALAS
jgi:hypothetical protein